MDKNSVKIMQYTNTGEVNSGGAEMILNSGAIGSCVVITAFDPYNIIGAMAHVMLPGSAPSINNMGASKYASNALFDLFSQTKSLGAEPRNLEVCIAGGANVLKRENDSIATENLKSVKKLLREKHINIVAETIGGFERRTVLFDIEIGCIYYTVGDSKQKILWQTSK